MKVVEDKKGEERIIEGGDPRARRKSQNDENPKKKKTEHTRGNEVLPQRREG